MLFYAIRQISTGHFMPNYGSRKGRGGWTNDEPQPLDIPPRLFRTRHTAQAALREWLKGVTVIKMRRGGNEWGEDDTVELVTEPRADRSAADMEIVKLFLDSA